MPVPSGDEFDDDFCPCTPSREQSEELIDLTVPIISAPPPLLPVYDPLEDSSSQPRRQSDREHSETLSDRVLRVAGDIAKTCTSKAEYAKLHRQDKFLCDLCNDFSNSHESRKAHNEGRKHKAKLAQEKQETSLAICARIHCELQKRLRDTTAV
eukprot:IDg3619t1